MHHILSFYAFVRLEERELSNLQSTLSAYGAEQNVEGLIILSCEGYNLTVAGSEASCSAFQTYFRSLLPPHEPIIKASQSNIKPFRRLKIDIRPEIITYLGKQSASPSKKTFLSPAEWHEKLESKSDYVLIDMRNTYETKLGKFRGAIDPEIKNFSDFPDYLTNSGIPKEKPILLYCTGGVRCEKAIWHLEREGYENVFQLHGGILKYLEEFPDGYFDGECFVFDHRVAVNSKLEPSESYHLCPHCGDPGEEKVVCGYCDRPAVVCAKCLGEKAGQSCSKNCRHHLMLAKERVAA